MATLEIGGHEVEVGDEFLKLSPDEQSAVVKKIASDLPASTPESAKGEGDTGVLHDVADQFSRRFNRGLSNLVQSPTTIANAISNVVGFGEPFEKPLDLLAPDLARSIDEVPEAKTAAGQVAGTVGEVAGGNAIPAMGVVGGAGKVAAMTAGAKNLAGQVVNTGARSVAAAPGAAAAGEAISTVGAGLGIETARAVAPDSPTAEFIGGAVGGIAAPAAVAVLPTNLARKGINAVRSRLSPDAVAKRQTGQIKEGLQQNLTPEAEQKILETLEIQQDVPGFKPSLAEATESPSFIATQRAFEGELSGPDLDAAIVRSNQNVSAVDAAKNNLAPQSTANLDDAFDQGRNRVEDLTAKLLDAERDVVAREIGVATRLPSGIRRADVGADIREQIAELRAGAKAELNLAAQDMGLNDKMPRYRFDRRVKQSLKESVLPRSELSDKNALPNTIVRDIDDMDEAVSVDDLMALRSRITDDIRTNHAKPDGHRKVQYLERLKAKLDEVSDMIIRETGDMETADNMRVFRARYRDEVAVPFERGATGRILKKDLGGAYRVPDENVAKEFFDGWNQTASRQFNRVFKDSTAGNAAMEAAAVDDLHAFSVRDGVLDPARVDAWKRKNAGVLGDFPDVGDRVSEIEGAVKSLAQRRAHLASRRKAVERSFLAREVAKLDNPISGSTPESVVDAAIKTPMRMVRLLNSVKGGEARRAISRHVWDRALTSANPREFLEANEVAVKHALGKQYKTALRLARAIEKTKLIPTPSGQPLDTNPVAGVENILGSGLNQISSRVFAVKSGRTSARYALADIAGRAFRNMTGNQARETLREVIYDPQVAVDLANAIEFERTSEKGARRLYTFLISSGVLAMEDE